MSIIKNRPDILYKQMIGPIFGIYQKSDRFFVYTKNLYDRLCIQDVGPIICICICNILTLRYEPNIGPTICLYKFTFRYFVYTICRANGFYRFVSAATSQISHSILIFSRQMSLAVWSLQWRPLSKPLKTI